VPSEEGTAPPARVEGLPEAGWSRGAAEWSILVHGGAGDVPAERKPLHVAGCERAVAVGAAVLEDGGSALDAVQRAVEALEDDPLFNAGTGACLDADGAITLDAALMNGAGLEAGGICALPPFKNPIAIARRVMDASPHVLLAGEGAARFAIAQGFVPADPESMITELARRRWNAARARAARENWSGGTVGAVARDRGGHVAAATSTGGLVNKLVGRVGDSPILGAGTYADDALGAASTTGHGEAMIRFVLAKALVDALATELPEAAARRLLAVMHARTGGTGGVIVVTKDGALGLGRTTPTMTWAAMTKGGRQSGG
jgi:L-asparaginase / beta-aspartyl-peptidase